MNQSISYKDKSLREFITKFLKKNPTASVSDTHFEVLTKFGRRTYSRVAQLHKVIKGEINE